MGKLFCSKWIPTSWVRVKWEIFQPKKISKTLEAPMLMWILFCATSKETLKKKRRMTQGRILRSTNLFSSSMTAARWKERIFNLQKRPSPFSFRVWTLPALTSTFAASVQIINLCSLMTSQFNTLKRILKSPDSKSISMMLNRAEQISFRRWRKSFKSWMIENYQHSAGLTSTCSRTDTWTTAKK